MMTSKEEWMSFQDRINACTNCLSGGGFDKCIYRGYVNTSLMIIGYKPSSEDMIKRQPFSDANGLMFQNLLDGLGLRPQDYHICNLIKCEDREGILPDSNRAVNCKMWLKEQIKLVRPKAIVIIGTYAYEELYKAKADMNSIHGLISRKNGFLVMPTYSLDEAFSDDRKKIELYKDINKLLSNIQG